MFFVCPVCGRELMQEEKSLVCANRHCYDISRHGYVNLLRSQQSGVKRHGDDKLMVRARRDFLDKGYYDALVGNAVAAVKRYSGDKMKILDAGCGECKYTDAVYRSLDEGGKRAEICGVDISRDALVYGAKRNSHISLAVAGIFDLPVADGDCDLLMNFFAPCAEREFFRVLKRGGILVRAIPLDRHLLGLKKQIYEQAYENKAEDLCIAGFSLRENIEVREKIQILCNEDIQNLFRMTPYYYKTGMTDQNKIKRLQGLETELAFGILIYERQGWL